MIGVVSLKILTDIFPADIYGQYVTLFEYIGFFAIVADFGLYTIAVSEMSKDHENRQEIFSNLLFLRLILIVVVLGLAVVITPNLLMYKDTLISQGIFLVSLMTGVTLLSGTLSAVLQFELQMQKAALAQLYSKVFYIIGVIYLWQMKVQAGVIESFDFLLNLNLATSVILLFFTWKYVAKYINFSLKFSKKYSLYLIKKALPYGLAIMLNKFYFKIDVLMIQAISGNFQAGIYAIPIKIMEILNLIPVFFMNSCLPFLSQSYQKSLKNLENLVLGSFKFLYVTICPILICGYFLAYPLTSFLSSPQFLSGYHCVNDARIISYSQEQAVNACRDLELSDFSLKGEFTESFSYYIGSDIAFKIILLALFFAFLNVVFNYYLLVSDKQSVLLKFNFLALGLNVLLNYLLIPKYGFIAASSVTVVCEALILFLGLSYYLRRHKLAISMKFLARIMCLSLLIGGMSYYSYLYLFEYMGNINLIILIPAIASLYFYLVQRLNIFSLGEVKELFSLKD